MNAGTVFLAVAIVFTVVAGGYAVFLVCREGHGDRVRRRTEKLVRPYQQQNSHNSDDTAYMLLSRLLNEEQRASLVDSNSFECRGGSTGQLYTIELGSCFNIKAGGGKLCASPMFSSWLPCYDVMLAQFLHLSNPETEIAFLKRANRI